MRSSQPPNPCPDRPRTRSSSKPSDVRSTSSGTPRPRSLPWATSPSSSARGATPTDHTDSYASCALRVFVMDGTSRLGPYPCHPWLSGKSPDPLAFHGARFVRRRGQEGRAMRGSPLAELQGEPVWEKGPALGIRCSDARLTRMGHPAYNSGWPFPGRVTLSTPVFSMRAASPDLVQCSGGGGVQPQVGHTPRARAPAPCITRIMDAILNAKTPASICQPVVQITILGGRREGHVGI